MTEARSTIRGGATLDPTGTYRYRLWREWGPGRSVCFIMLNPSTADALEDDQTIRRCVKIAQGWGFGRLEVVNLFGLRSRDPMMIAHHIAPEGPENDFHIREVGRRCDLVVAAWGVMGCLRGRDRQVVQELAAGGVKLMALYVTKDGFPKHPLYTRAVPLEELRRCPWPRRVAVG